MRVHQSQLVKCGKHWCTTWKDVLSVHAWWMWGLLPPRVQEQMAQLLPADLPPKCAVWQDPWVPGGQDSYAVVVSESILWITKRPMLGPWHRSGAGCNGNDNVNPQGYTDIGLKMPQHLSPPSSSHCFNSGRAPTHFRSHRSLLPWKPMALWPRRVGTMEISSDQKCEITIQEPQLICDN